MKPKIIYLAISNPPLNLILYLPTYILVIIGIICFAVILWLIAEPLAVFKTIMRTSSRAGPRVSFACFMPAMIQINRTITGRQDDVEDQSYQLQAVTMEMIQPEYN